MYCDVSWLETLVRGYVCVCWVIQIASDCNENIRRAENELKLFAITKRFPHDEVEVVPARWITSNGACVCACVRVCVCVCAHVVVVHMCVRA